MASGAEQGAREGEEMEEPMLIVGTSHYVTDEVCYVTTRSHLLLEWAKLQTSQLYDFTKSQEEMAVSINCHICKEGGLYGQFFTAVPMSVYYQQSNPITTPKDYVVGVGSESDINKLLLAFS